MYSRMNKLELSCNHMKEVLREIGRSINKFHEGGIDKEEHMKELSIYSYQLKRIREYINLNTTYVREKIADVTKEPKNHL